MLIVADELGKRYERWQSIIDAAHRMKIVTYFDCAGEEMKQLKFNEFAAIWMAKQRIHIIHIDWQGEHRIRSSVLLNH